MYRCCDLNCIALIVTAESVGLLTFLTPCFTALLRMKNYITVELLLQTQACMP